MFGDAFDELLMQDRIDQYKAMLNDGQAGFRRQLERLDRGAQPAAIADRPSRGRLGAIVQSVRSVVRTTRAHAPTGTAA